MCVVSMIMDHYHDKWYPRLPQPGQTPVYPYWPNLPVNPVPQVVPTDKQIEELMKPKEPAITHDEIREFRELLERAREYDRRNNEPDCELAEKRQAILDIAKKLGVDISFL